MPAPEADLALLVEAARIAGAVALRYWKQNPQVWEKPGDEGPVTEADYAVNEALEAHLRGARPTYGWLSEESADNPARLDCEHVFILDPIDGTRAFINGEDSFTHSIAIATGGVVTAGVVFAPALDRMFAARIDGPATLNGDVIHAATRHRLDGATFLTPAVSLKPEFWPGGVPPITRTFRPSVAYRLSLVAQGRFDGMMSFRNAWEWDIAAGSLIAERAGAKVTDRGGHVLRFNSPNARTNGLIATNPDLHDALMARIA